MTQKFDAVNRPTENEKNEIVDFLYTHLEEYGDPKPAIKKAINYSVKEHASFGGFTLVIRDDKEITGVVVVNETGMEGYIPENILVYIATHSGHRGKGIGKRLMEDTINYAKGDIALHVEKDNPAKFLYEKYGFKNPYLEMRLKR
ncbi:GNAT family N-acetyltransferase [bacterium]|nr:GNAT family N-acetyltransferase [bacterium]